MKKWIFGMAVVIMAACSSLYVFIPGTLHISKTVVIPCTTSGAGRYLLDKEKWNRWWPKDDRHSYAASGNGNKNLMYDGYTYLINRFSYNSVNMDIQKPGIKVNSNLNMIPLNMDSTLIVWNCSIPTHMNPVKRLRDYQNARSIKNSITGILTSLQQFLDTHENIYGIHIRNERFRDTFLVAAKTVFASYPGTPEIYKMIHQLQGYIARRGASETSFPMLNVTDSGSGRYVTMVAIPTDKKLEDSGSIKFMRFFNTRILVSEIRGGPFIIRNAYTQMKNFIEDNSITSPAKPFEMLITNRTREVDTAKWITRIYYPAFLKPGF